VLAILTDQLASAINILPVTKERRVVRWPETHQSGSRRPCFSLFMRNLRLCADASAISAHIRILLTQSLRGTTRLSPPRQNILAMIVSRSWPRRLPASKRKTQLPERVPMSHHRSLNASFAVLPCLQQCWRFPL
jgi:hypothetical protein